MNFKILVLVGLVGLLVGANVTPLHARFICEEDIPFQHQSDIKPWLYAYVPDHSDFEDAYIFIYDAYRNLLKKNLAVDLFGDAQKTVGEVVCWMPQSSILLVSVSKKASLGYRRDYIAYEVEPTGDIKPTFLTEQMRQQALRSGSFFQ
jgi:hypothetical protein